MTLHSCRSFIFLAAYAAVAGGCRRAAPTKEAPPPPEVTVSQPVRRQVTDYHHYTGRIDSVEKVEVRARVEGYLKKVAFKEGTEVQKGSLLYQIDPRTFEADVEKAKADVERARAQRELARAEAARAGRLVRTRAVSEEEYQQKLAARETAGASLGQAQAALRSAELQLSFTRITAPIPGRVGRTLVTEGNLVGFGQPTLLTTIVRVDPMYVYFQVPERNYLLYQGLVRRQKVPTAEQAKVPVFVGLETEKGYPHKGTIEFRSNEVDPGTGTIQLRGVLPNPDRVLIPGLFARVRVPIGKPQERLLVPEVALSADQRGRYLLVVNDDDTVEYRSVTVGPTRGDLVVIESGLHPDDWVIVNGIQRARPGATVRPERVARGTTGPAGGKGEQSSPQKPPGTGASPPTSKTPVPPVTSSPGGSTK